MRTRAPSSATRGGRRRSHSATRRYLDKAGVVDALTKALVGLYEEPERPPNAVDYVKRVMGAAVGIDVDALKAENAQLKAEVAPLREKVAALQSQK